MTARALATLLAAATLFIAADAASAVEDKPDGAAIVRGEGRVRPEGARDWRSTTSGSVITAGVTVEAAKDAPLELTLPDGVEITLEPGANATWKPPGRLPTEHNGWARGYHMQLNDGEVHVRMPVEPRGKRAFLVSTRAGTLTDWRGSVTVSVHDDVTAAAIYEGALVVGSNGQGFPVYDGAGIVMQKSKNPERRAIPSAPAFDERSTAPLAVVYDGERSPLAFAWKGVEGAGRYRVEIATDPKMWRVVHRGTTASTSFTIPPSLQGNRFYTRVRAIGSDGIVGGWSTIKGVHAVRVGLPEGAFVARDGTIVVPPDASVSLLDHEGLETAYEVLRTPGPRISLPLHYMPAPEKVQVGDELLRVVHLRDRSGGAHAEIPLARRALKANVELTPKRARWPEDPIDVRVSLVDPSGRLDPRNEKVTVETLIDISPVEIAWKRTGTTLTARVPPRGGSSPTIVRVMVKDARGAEIGAGFLEIEGARTAARPDPHVIHVYR